MSVFGALPLRPLHLFSAGGRGRGGGGRRSSIDKSLVFVLLLTFIGLGAFMYFGTMIGTGKLEFVDLRLRVESIEVPAGMGLYGHAIIGVSGFNSVVVSGKVRANDYVPGDIWVAAQVFVTGVCDHCDPAGCGRTIYLEPQVTYPNPGCWYLVQNIGGMAKGEVKSFQFAIDKNTILNELQRTKFSLEDKIPSAALEAMEGKVRLAIIRVPNPPSRTTTIYYVSCSPAANFKTVDAFKWRFNIQTGKQTYNPYGQSIIDGTFMEITTVDDGITISKQSIPEIMGQAIELELKLSATAAVVMFVSAVLTIMSQALVRKRRGSGGKGGGPTFDFLAFLAIILLAAVGAITGNWTLVIVMVGIIILLRLLSRK